MGYNINKLHAKIRKELWNMFENSFFKHALKQKHSFRIFSAGINDFSYTRQRRR